MVLIPYFMVVVGWLFLVWGDWLLIRFRTVYFHFNRLNPLHYSPSIEYVLCSQCMLRAVGGFCHTRLQIYCVSFICLFVLLPHYFNLKCVCWLIGFNAHFVCFYAAFLFVCSCFVSAFCALWRNSRTGILKFKNEWSVYSKNNAGLQNEESLCN